MNNHIAVVNSNVNGNHRLTIHLMVNELGVFWKSHVFVVIQFARKFVRFCLHHRDSNKATKQISSTMLVNFVVPTTRDNEHPNFTERMKIIFLL